MPQEQISYKQLQRFCSEEGISLLGVTDGAPLIAHRARLSSWFADGNAGDLTYLTSRQELLTTPTMLMENVASIIICAIPYYSPPAQPCPPEHGRIARYAAGKDYHRVIKKQLLRVTEKLSALAPDGTHRVFTDAVPLLERALAERAGLGFYGRNSLLIYPSLGSFFFIGEILTSLHIEQSLLSKRFERGCGTCTRCPSHCPTGAILSDRTIDARRCISYLTIEKRGSLEIWERKAIGDWLLGCDLCQEICPFNHRAMNRNHTAIPERFLPEHGVGVTCPLETLLSIRTDQEFLARYQGTPLMRPGREGMLRNAAVVSANTKTYRLVPLLSHVAEVDSSAVVREHAAWAVAELQAHKKV
jgi:epoxyqueuosine reductase